jgi:1-acyl-sn-glycerol-3-phosphate acyltransferase
MAELPQFSAGRLGRALFVAPWTMLVTASAVTLAKTTGRPAWVPRGERLWARGLLRAWGVHVEVEWPEDLAITEPYVVMANHTSHVDVPLLFMALPFVPGFLAKKELDRVPFLSMALRAGGHVLLDRSDRGSAMQALRAAAEHVRRGNTVAVFPEGTRGDGRTLLPFKKGGFLIAKSAKVAILPVGIRGSHAVLPREAFLPRAANVRVVAGQPISSLETRRLSVNELIARVRSQIAELSGVSEMDPGSEASCSRISGAAPRRVAAE